MAIAESGSIILDRVFFDTVAGSLFRLQVVGKDGAAGKSKSQVSLWYDLVLEILLNVIAIHDDDISMSELHGQKVLGLLRSVVNEAKLIILR